MGGKQERDVRYVILPKIEVPNENENENVIVNKCQSVANECQRRLDSLVRNEKDSIVWISSFVCRCRCFVLSERSGLDLSLCFSSSLQADLVR